MADLVPEDVRVVECVELVVRDSESELERLPLTLSVIDSDGDGEGVWLAPPNTRRGAAVTAG